MGRAMRVGLALGVLGLLGAACGGASWAQTPANMLTLQGLAPVSRLAGTAAGRAALQANFDVTAGIQNGTLRQPTLLPFAEQQQLAIRDAFITGGNATELADGLGTRLGGIYQAQARYQDWKTFTNISPALAVLFAYSNATTASDSNAGKYFFANGTMDGKAPASDAAAAILRTPDATADVFGKAYGRPAGSEGANAFGNSRPFQTVPGMLAITGPDYFGVASSAQSHLSGPATNLRDSPAFPSGHSTFGTLESVLLALLLPERYQQEVTRGAEYGNDRIILGAHYAMDVIAGRTLALHDVAHLLANDPRFVGMPKAGVVITDYPAALAAARADLMAALQAACGDTILVCAAEDTSRFADPAANEAFVAVTQTYGLPAVHAGRAAAVDFGTVAPDAGRLLTAAFPHLTLDQANAILTETQGPGGGFLDDGSAFGAYSRINLYAAAKRAAGMALTQ